MTLYLTIGGEATTTQVGRLLDVTRQGAALDRKQSDVCIARWLYVYAAACLIYESLWPDLQNVL